MDITSFSCPSKDTILQNTMNKLESIWDEISYPKGFILFTKDKIERDVYLIKQGIANGHILKWTEEILQSGLGRKMILLYLLKDM